jgi:hypothetical protein
MEEDFSWEEFYTVRFFLKDNKQSTTDNIMKKLKKINSEETLKKCTKSTHN